MTGRWLAAIAAAIACCAISPSPASSAKPPATWDDLVLVKSKMGAVYLRPGADFRPYTKVMLDPTEAAFHKDWQREQNQASRGVSRQVSDADIERALALVRNEFGAVFAKACADAGYQVVTTPGPDVVRLRTAVLNLRVTAPDLPTAGRSRTFSREAGEATLVLEVRDSVSGAILGRAVDRRVAGDMGPYMRSSVSNRADFQSLFRLWAKRSVAGLAELKAKSPIGAAGTPKK